MEVEVSHRVVGEVGKVLGALLNIWEERSVSGRVKMGMLKGTVVPTVLYECKAGAINDNVGECVGNEMLKDSMWYEVSC